MSGSSDPVLDLEAALACCHGKPDLLQRAAQAFVRTYAGLPARVAESAASGDFDAVADVAHTLKGAAPILGATALRAAAEALESAHRQGDRARMLEQIPRFLADFDEAYQALQALNTQTSVPAPTGRGGAAAGAIALALVPLLRAGDMEAGSRLDALCAALAGHPQAAQAQHIRALFDELETEQAADLAQVLAAQLGAS